MRFKRAKQSHAYCDTMNWLKLDIEEVFWKYEKKLRLVRGDSDTLRALREEVLCLQRRCCGLVKGGLDRFSEEWDE